MEARTTIGWLLGLAAAGALGLLLWSSRGGPPMEPGSPLAPVGEIGSDPRAVAVRASEPTAEPSFLPAAAAEPESTRAPAARAQRAGGSPVAAPRLVRGRIDFPGGAPLDPELTVVLRSGVSEGRTELSAVPNALGRFELVLAADARRAALDLEGGYHYLSEPLRLDFDDDPAARDHVLAPRTGGRLLVRLVATDGSDPRPFEGFSVAVLGEELREQRRSVAVDETGTVRFDGLPAGTKLFVTAATPGYARRADLVEPWASLSLLAGRERELELSIEREVRLSGSVRSPSGAPLERARVSAESRGAASFGWKRGAHTDAEGRFELGSLQAGALRLRADHPVFLGAELDLGTLAPGEERAGIAVVLEAGSELSGTLLWPDGSPAEGVTIFLRVASEEESASSFLDLAAARVRTDAEGRFSTAGLGSAGPFHLDASARPRGEAAARLAAAGYTPEERRARAEFQVRRRGVLAGERELVLVLGAGESLRGRVIDPAGRPLPRARLTLRALEDREGPTKYAVRAEDGSFVLHGLAPGSYSASASAGAGYGEAVSIELPQQGPELVLVAPLGGSIAGRVSAGGKPLANVEVRLRGARGEPLGLTSFDEHEKQTRSDAQGRFEFPAVAPGEQVLEAELAGAGRSAPVTVQVIDGEAVAGVVLELERLGWIEGRLADDIAPRAGRSIHVQDETRHTLEFLRTDGQGRFTVPNLRAGLYSVSLAGPSRPANGEGFGDMDTSLSALAFDEAQVRLDFELPAIESAGD